MTDGDVVIELTELEANFFAYFLSGACEQMKDQCSMREAELPETKEAFRILTKIIEQLPKLRNLETGGK